MRGNDYYFKIKPIDDLFFRNGSTFTKDSKNIIQSMDIPYPSVIYGAIFSELLRQGLFKDVLKCIQAKTDDIEDKMKEKFQIEKVFIYDELENKIFINAPLDLFTDAYSTVLGIYDDELMFSPESMKSRYERADGKFIELSDLIKLYSKGKIDKLKLYDRDYFFTNYMKTGISIDKSTKSVKQGDMYRINLVEFRNKKFSFLIKCKLNEVNSEIKTGTLKFGGESKLASFSYTNQNIEIIDQIEEFYKNTIIDNGEIKLILTSPMIIDGEVESNYLQSDVLNKLNIKICVTGKPNYIGGYDLARNKQKQIRRAIPAGSILVIKNDKFKGKNISSILKEYIKNVLDMKDSFRGFSSLIVVPFIGGQLDV